MLTIDRKSIPPTLGYEEPDPEIHLDVVAGAARPWEPGTDPVQLVRVRRPQRLPGHLPCLGGPDRLRAAGVPDVGPRPPSVVTP